jgi:signal transduction histidine kinase
VSPHYPPSSRHRPQSPLLFRGLHVFGMVCIVGSFLLVESLQVTVVSSELWPALIAMVPMLLLLLRVDGSRKAASAVAYLLVGGAALFVVAAAVVSQVPVADASGTFPLVLLKIALIVVGGPAKSRVASAAWPIAGFAVGEVAVGTATVLVQGALEFDLTALAAAAAAIALRVVVLSVGARDTPARETLGLAAREETLAADRGRTEMRAAALLHDTVLNDLSTVASAHTGSLQPELRSQLKRDLSLLSGGHWRAGETAVLESDRPAESEVDELVAVVALVRELGLQVDVVGDLSVVRDLAAEHREALALAVHQCLINVAKHSGTSRAEIVVARSQNVGTPTAQSWNVGTPTAQSLTAQSSTAQSLKEVSVMVVDNGRGFAVEEPREDRLGLRQSVIRTVEDVGGSVRIWSAPGRGTSVMLRVPSL